MKLLLLGIILSGCSGLQNDTLGLTVNEWKDRTFGEQLISKTRTMEVWQASRVQYIFENGRLVEIERQKITREELEARRIRAERLRPRRRSRTDVYIHQGPPIFIPQPLP